MTAFDLSPASVALSPDDSLEGSADVELEYSDSFEKEYNVSSDANPEDDSTVIATDTVEQMSVQEPVVMWGLRPNIFYAAPQLLAFSQLSKFTRELVDVINEAENHSKIKEIMTVSHSVTKNHSLTFNSRGKLGDGMWLCTICVHEGNWDKARVFRDWRDGWENWMKSEGLLRSEEEPEDDEAETEEAEEDERREAALAEAMTWLAEMFGDALA